MKSVNFSLYYLMIDKKKKCTTESMFGALKNLQLDDYLRRNFTVVSASRLNRRDH